MNRTQCDSCTRLVTVIAYDGTADSRCTVGVPSWPGRAKEHLCPGHHRDPMAVYPRPTIIAHVDDPGATLSAIGGLVEDVGVSIPLGDVSVEVFVGGCYCVGETGRGGPVYLGRYVCTDGSSVFFENAVLVLLPLRGVR